MKGASKPVSSRKAPAKKPYSRPQLVVFGDVREVTEAVGSHATPDGGLAPNTMTKP